MAESRNTGGTRRRRALKARARVAFMEGFMESGSLLNGEKYEYAQEVMDPKDKVNRSPEERIQAEKFLAGADKTLDEVFEDWWKDRPDE